jgi:hypothetical protein
MEIYRDKYRIIDFEETTQILRVVWFESSEEMTEEEYIRFSHETPSYVEKYNANKVIMNTENFKFVVVPEIQNNLNKEVIPRYLKAGVSRFAFILPSEIFAQVSIQQAIDDSSSAVKQGIRYFGDEQTAYAWLLE